MDILILLLIVLLIAGLAIYAVDLFPIGSPFNNLLKLLIIIVAIIVIAERAL